MEIFAFVLAVVALIWVYRNGNVLRGLQEQQLQLQKESARLNIKLEKLASELRKLRDSFSTVETAPPAPPAQPAPATSKPEQAKHPEPPIVAPSVVTPAEGAVRPPVLDRPVTPPPTAPQPPKITPPPPPPPPIGHAPPAPPILPRPNFDWEALIGVKLFSWIAGVALVFAAIFFLKYSVDHGWLGPPIRMAIGLVTGAALLV